MNRPVWKKVKLDAVVDIIDPHPSHRAPDAVERGIPFFGIGDLNEDGTYNLDRVRRVAEEIYDEHVRRYIVSKNTIGFGRVATIGKVINFKNPTFKYTVSPTLAILEPKESVIRDYVLHSLKGEVISEQIDKLLTGSTRSSLGIELLRKLTLDLPEKKEQQKIAHILTAVDNLIEKTQSLIDKYTAIKQGMMHDLFTRGIDLATGVLRPRYEDAPHLYKETELGWVPKEWGVYRIKDVSRVIDSLHQTPVFSDEGVPMVRVTDIKGGKIDFSSCAKVSARVYEKFTEVYKPRKNDIVLSRVGSYGISSFSDEDTLFCMGQNTVVITSHKNMVFFYEVLQTKITKRQFDLFVAGSSQKSLSLKAIKETFIPNPLDIEQVAISKRLASINAVLENQLFILMKFQLQKKGLMQDLLTGRVRVG